MPDKVNIHAGHRSRMREKFSLYGREVFHTHELLEMLLFHAVPYKNTNPLAKNLIARFSTLDGVLSAARSELLEVEGVGPKIADMIIAVGKINVHDSAQKTSESENVSRSFIDYGETGEFFTKYFDGKLSYETVVLLLNNKMESVGFEVLYNADYETALIKSSPFIDAAMKYGASVAVIAHNHPYGPAFPTPGDMATNAMVADSLERAGVLLAEHYIVSGKSYVGFMNNLSTAFSQASAVAKFFMSKERAK